MWGLLLSGATICLSLMTKSDQNNIPSSTLALTHDNKLFLSGAVLGVGCSMLFSSLTSYFRIPERLHLLYLYFTNVDATKDLYPYRQPTRAIDTETIKQTEEGFVKLVLSPDTAATGSLNVSLLSVKPGCEIPPSRSAGVEFYYIVSGSGSFSQQGVVETKPVHEGDCVVVGAFNMRWMSNKGRDDLVLLRATDGGDNYGHERSSVNMIRRDPMQKKSVANLAKITSGVRKMQEAAREYYIKRN